MKPTRVAPEPPPKAELPPPLPSKEASLQPLRDPATDEAAAQVQTAMRGKKARGEAATDEATAQVQAAIRGKQARAVAKSAAADEDNAAATVQAAMRGKQARQAATRGGSAEGGEIRLSASIDPDGSVAIMIAPAA